MKKWLLNLGLTVLMLSAVLVLCGFTGSSADCGDGELSYSVTAEVTAGDAQVTEGQDYVFLVDASTDADVTVQISYEGTKNSVTQDPEFSFSGTFELENANADYGTQLDSTSFEDGAEIVSLSGSISFRTGSEEVEGASIGYARIEIDEHDGYNTLDMDPEGSPYSLQLNAKRSVSHICGGKYDAHSYRDLVFFPKETGARGYEQLYCTVCGAYRNLRYGRAVEDSSAYFAAAETDFRTMIYETPNQVLLVAVDSCKVTFDKANAENLKADGIVSVIVRAGFEEIEFELSALDALGEGEAVVITVDAEAEELFTFALLNKDGAETAIEFPAK